MLCLLDFIQGRSQGGICFQQEITARLAKGIVRGFLGFLGLGILQGLTGGNKLRVIILIYLMMKKV